MSEIALLADHARWFAPHLPDPTRRGGIHWIAIHLRDEAGRRIAARLPLDHVVQHKAEHALKLLLARRLTTTTRRSRVSEVVGRDVDWARTYEAACGVVPARYIERNRVRIPDQETIAALAGIARSWVSVLRTFGNQESHRARAQGLRDALQGLAPVRNVPYSVRHERRLHQLDPEARSCAIAIRESLVFWDRPFGESDGSALASIARLLTTDDADNVNNLLEVVATLSIARAACQFESKTEHAWKVHSIGAQGGLTLKRGTLRCRIYKGLPSTESEDRLNPSLRAMGFAPKGNQPDINLRFWHVDRPQEAAYAIADAKRNAKREKEYLRESLEVAAVYAMSYSHLLGASFVYDVDYPFGLRAAVHPAVTLFCRKGVDTVLGKRDTAEIVRAFASDDPLPPFAALDLENHFPLTENGWDDRVIGAWFERVSRQAERALAARGDCATRARGARAS